jgi:serine/threonine-protein kinase
VKGDWDRVAADPVGWLLSGSIGMSFVIVVVFPWLVGVLCRWRSQSVGRLRWIEGAVFGLIAAACGAYALHENIAVLPQGIAPMTGTLPWFACLVTYGTLIPNTARRCLLAVSLMTVAAAASMLGPWLYFGAPVGLVFGGVVVLVNYFGVAVAITVTGAHWVERLRREALEARRLGQYVLRQRLGAGGMGEVYLAEHRLLRRPAAIKLIRPERAGDPKNLLRFEREVQATAMLTHPNTVQVYDYGRAEDGTFYYVMEYLPGATLEEHVNREGPLPPARAVHFLRQICGALREAHGQGLLHRDIKPGNVMVCERGGVPDVAKLLDFGLVLPLATDAEGDKLTQDGAVAGTPAYLSPEQAGGQEVLDARSDIYSVGALAYFLLTGRPPFAGRSRVQVLAAHLYEEPERLSARRPGIPGDLESVVARCLAKSPEERFPDVGCLDAALAACCCEGASPGWDQA